MKRKVSLKDLINIIDENNTGDYISCFGNNGSCDHHCKNCYFASYNKEEWVNQICVLFCQKKYNKIIQHIQAVTCHLMAKKGSFCSNCPFNKSSSCIISALKYDCDISSFIEAVKMIVKYEKESEFKRNSRCAG